MVMTARHDSDRRTATLVVAASDSPAWIKRCADYVCDGVDDHSEIQAALAALPSTIANIGIKAALAYNATTTTYTDDTVAANNAIANDMTLLPAAPAVNDAYYFGFRQRVDKLILNVGTAGVGGWTITWEYYDGALQAWAALAGVIDGTNGFRVAGINEVTWTSPGAWTEIEIAGVRARWMRARVSAFVPGAVTQPFGTQAWMEARVRGGLVKLSAGSFYVRPDQVAVPTACALIGCGINTRIIAQDEVAWGSLIACGQFVNVGNMFLDCDQKAYYGISGGSFNYIHDIWGRHPKDDIIALGYQHDTLVERVTGWETGTAWGGDTSAVVESDDGGIRNTIRDIRGWNVFSVVSIHCHTTTSVCEDITVENIYGGKNTHYVVAVGVTGTDANHKIHQRIKLRKILGESMAAGGTPIAITDVNNIVIEDCDLTPLAWNTYAFSISNRVTNLIFRRNRLGSIDNYRVLITTAGGITLTSDLTFEDNDFQYMNWSGAYGFNLVGVSRVNILNNRFNYSNGEFIRLEDVTDFRISGNIFKDGNALGVANAGQALASAIALYGASLARGDIDNNKIISTLAAANRLYHGIWYDWNTIVIGAGIKVGKNNDWRNRNTTGPAEYVPILTYRVRELLPDVAGLLSWRYISLPTVTGWSTSHVNGGAIQAVSYQQVNTSVNADSRGMLYVSVRGMRRGAGTYWGVHFGNYLVIKFNYVRQNADGEAVARVQLKLINTEGALANHGLGWRIDNLTVMAESYGTGGLGVIATGVVLSNLTDAEFVIAHYPGVRTDWYINGHLVAQQTDLTLIPSVDIATELSMVHSIINGATGTIDAISAVMGYEIWQQRR